MRITLKMSSTLLLAVAVAFFIQMVKVLDAHIKEPSSTNFDIVMVVQESPSFRNQYKEKSIKVVELFDIGLGKELTRISLAFCGRRVTTHFDQSVNEAFLKNEIKKSNGEKYDYGEHWYACFELAFELFDESKGARPNSPNVLLVVADGNGNYQHKDFEHLVSNNVRSKNVSIFVLSDYKSEILFIMVNRNESRILPFGDNIRYLLKNEPGIGTPIAPKCTTIQNAAQCMKYDNGERCRKMISQKYDEKEENVSCCPTLPHIRYVDCQMKDCWCEKNYTYQPVVNCTDPGCGNFYSINASRNPEGDQRCPLYTTINCTVTCTTTSTTSKISTKWTHSSRSASTISENKPMRNSSSLRSSSQSATSPHSETKNSFAILIVILVLVCCIILIALVAGWCYRRKRKVDKIVCISPVVKTTKEESFGSFNGANAPNLSLPPLSYITTEYQKEKAQSSIPIKPVTALISVSKSKQSKNGSFFTSNTKFNKSSKSVSTVPFRDKSKSARSSKSALATNKSTKRLKVSPPTANTKATSSKSWTSKYTPQNAPTKYQRSKATLQIK